MSEKLILENSNVSENHFSVRVFADIICEK